MTAVYVPATGTGTPVAAAGRLPATGISSPAPESVSSGIRKSRQDNRYSGLPGGNQ